MKRYQTELTVDTSKNIPYFETLLLTESPVEEVPYFYVARGNQRLDNISTLFYKTPSKWWIIAKVNNLANGTVSVSDGTKLRIPNV
jgi:hypothetical protein